MHIYDILFTAKTGKIKPFSNPYDAAFGNKIWDDRDKDSYGYHVDHTNSNSDSAVTYISKNIGYTVLGLGSNNVFSWGSWKNSWIIEGIKPCILSASGEVLMYLDVTDYSKDIYGNPAPITQEDLDTHEDTRFHGANVMVEFPKIWTKVVPDSDNQNSYSVYFSQTRIDEDYKDYAYISPSGEHKEHFYRSVYPASLTDGKLRSVSNAQVKNNITLTDSRLCAEANGDGWHIDTYSECILIAQVLTLLGKNLNTQTRFGQGRTASSITEQGMAAHRTGSENASGMFAGDMFTVDTPLKVLGIEDYWGVCNRWLDGLVMNTSYQLLLKMCYGTEDGSTGSDYSDYSRYLNTQRIIDQAEFTERTGYLSWMAPIANGALLPSRRKKNVGNYYADGCYNYSVYEPIPEGIDMLFATRGGSWTLKSGGSGAYNFAVDTVVDEVQWKIGTSISYV